MPVVPPSPVPEPDATTQVEDLLLRVLDAPLPDRPRILDEVCVEQPHLAAGVRQRLHELAAMGMLGEADPAASTASRPKNIGPYRILDVLGQGGMGLVYLADHEQLGRRVALKCIRPEFLGSERARERFRRETQAVARLQHPGLATLYETGEWQGQPFLAMQYVAGESLDEQLRRSRAVGHTAWSSSAATRDATTATTRRSAVAACRDAVALIADLARAVHEVHEAGVVHRDLKPGNVMVTPAGKPVLLDFGLARDLSDDVPNLTLSSDVVGTPAYMAPEQIEPRGRTIDRRTDVHALGALLYECLTLRPPFAGGSREEIYRRILSEEPVELRRLQPAASRDLASVVHKALAKEPRARFADAITFVDELQRVLRGEPTRTRPAGALRRSWHLVRQRPALSATLATAFVALAIGLVIALRFLRQERAAVRTYEAVEITKRDPARGAVRAAEALDAGGGEPARSALYAALSELRLVQSWPLINSATAVVASDDGRVMAAAIWGMAEKEWASTVHLFRDGVEVRRLIVAGRTRSLHLDQGRDRLLAIGHLPSARLFDLQGNLIALLPAQPDDVFASLAPLTVAEGIPFGTIAGGMHGDTVFTITRDGHVRIFDLQGQVVPARCLHVPKVDGADWIAADRHPDTGAVLLGNRKGNVVQVGADGRRTGTELRLPGPAAFVAFAPGGDRMAAATGHRQLWYDIDSADEHVSFEAVVFDAGALRVALRGHTDYLTDLQWDATGRCLLTTSEDQTARLWPISDVRDETSLRAVVMPHTVPVWFGRFRRDGTGVVTGMAWGDVALWDLQGHRVGTLAGHGSGCIGVSAVGPNHLLTSTMDLRLMLWDLRSKSLRRHAAGGRIVAAFWTPAGEVWSARISGQMQRWAEHPTRPEQTIDLAPRLRAGETLTMAMATTDGGTFCVATNVGRLLAVDRATGVEREIAGSVGHDRLGKPYFAGSLFRNGPTAFARTPVALVPFALDGKSDPGPTLRGFPGHELMWFSRHPHRALGAVPTTGANVLLFDLTDGREVGRSANLGSTVMGAAWGGPDLLFAVTRDGLVLALDADLRERWRRELGVLLWNVVVAPDGRSLLVKCADRRARVLSIGGDLLLVLPEVVGTIQSITFSPDGRQVLVASYDGDLQIWPLWLQQSGAEMLVDSPYRAALDEARGRWK